MLPLINRHQPERPRFTDEGDLLLYRTRPKKGKNYIRLDSIQNQIAMLRLYRAARKGDIPKQVLIAELYDYLELSSVAVSKRHMGQVVVNAVLYNPRLLINRAEIGKPVMSYIFKYEIELQYGLEWMICAWLRQFLNENSAPEDAVSGPDEIAEELDILASTGPREYEDLYESPLIDFQGHFTNPDWNKLAMENGWELNEELVAQREQERPPSERKPLTDYSVT